MDILVSLPISLINPWTLERENVIDTNSVVIKNIYNGQQFDVEWFQNQTALDLHTDVSLQSAQSDLREAQLINEESGIKSLIGGRNRRSVENSYFNPYLQKVVETNQSSISNDATPMNDRLQLDSFSVNDRILSNLPSNRTIHFNCNNSNQDFCLVGRFRVSNFKASNSPILITLNFTIDMAKMGDIMYGKRDILVIRTEIDLMETSENYP